MAASSKVMRFITLNDFGDIILLIKLADDVVAHVLEQIVPYHADDGIEEGHVLDHVGSIVSTFQEGVDTCCEVVGQVVSQHALEQT